MLIILVMFFNCPQCGTTMVKKIVDTTLGYREAWYCELCDGFYSEKKLKEIIFNI
jgi:transcription elongation factor Elf1